MKLKPYSKMKDSGVEWIGEIPEEWKKKKLKFISKLFGRIGFRGYTVDDIVNDYEGAITLSPSNIIDDKFNLDKKTYLSWTKYEESPEIQIFENDILLVKTGSTIGKICIVDNQTEKMTINPQLVVLKSLQILPKFLTYFMRSNKFKDQIYCDIVGGSTPTISQEKIFNYYILSPTYEQQKQVVKYLDKKSIKIDSEISKNQKLIKLLKEKRQSTINDIVTKGLDPTVSMKDSGIGWIGKIPTEWSEPTISRLKQMKIILDFQDGNHGELHPKGDDFIEYGIPFLTAQQIDEYGKIDFIKANKLSEQFCKKLRIGFAKPNDVFFTHNATVGRVGIMSEDAPNSIIGTSITYYRLDDSKIDRKFFAYMMQSNYIYSQYEPIMKQSTRNQISILKQAKLRVLFPHIDEQKQIADFLDTEISKINLFILKIESQIEKLEELRQSLISSAVTGKIDLRNYPISV